jgi:3'(2'), 5'-bisphosphate nucleotidase
MDQQLHSALKEIIIKAGKMSVDLRDEGLNIQKKSDDSPVTNADQEISNFIYANLTKLSPNIPIICEEQPLKNVDNERQFWLVDPIDGTKSYVKNMDSFTVNIALINNKVPVIGLIYQPMLKKLYFTDPEGKFCIEQNGENVELLERKTNSHIAVVSSRNFNEKTKDYIKENNFSEIIAIPSSIKLCMIAEGSATVYPKFGPTMEWDIAAGHALINASSGKVIDKSTGQELLYGKADFKNPDFIAYGSE